MTNLLRLVVSIVDDPEARAALRADPDAAVAGVDDLTGEDVVAVAEVARVQFDASGSDVLAVAVDPRPRADETPYAVAIRLLLRVCDAAEAAER